MSDPIHTVNAAAKLLSLHPFTVLKLIKHGELRAAKIGRVYRIRESSIDAFMEKHSS